MPYLIQHAIICRQYAIFLTFLFYIKNIFLDKNDEICGYEFVHMGKFMDEIKKGTDANEALKKVTGTYGRVTAEQGAVKHIDPRHE